MNDRERFIATLTFGNPDKICLQIGGGRESTLKRWHQEGLPEGAKPADFVLNELGISREEHQVVKGFFFNQRMNPVRSVRLHLYPERHRLCYPQVAQISC
jgi:hypothetical protein